MVYKPTSRMEHHAEWKNKLKNMAIKEKKLRPYTYDELKAEMAKGKIAVEQIEEPKRIFTITQVFSDYGIATLSDWSDFSYINLLYQFQWLDGTPCGVEE